MYKVKCSAAWTRTKDPSLNRGSLYQLSYRGMFIFYLRKLFPFRYLPKQLPRNI